MQLKQVVFLGWPLRKLVSAFFFMLYILSFNGWRVFFPFSGQRKVKENLVNLEALRGIGTVDGAA